ncbi:cytochrome c [Reinekea sp. G2M2-21]|uniref:c-type cytochrome n=1 Tax=Reinekea sp. G2M2-21 TaxID=2788942 RepID=UPI0018A9CE43|nr:cytochrome c [Reinekea sp. G2M2-21]
MTQLPFKLFLLVSLTGSNVVASAEETAGADLYQTYCAACHGVNGEGDTRWPGLNETGDMTAPPHNDKGHTWRHSTEELIGMTLNGHRDPYNQSDALTMPAFNGILSREQVADILNHVKQWWTPKQLDAQSRKDD